LTRLRALQNGTSRYFSIFLSGYLVAYKDFFFYPKVGDGLEMYVVLAKGADPRLVHGVQGIQELTSVEDAERVFVIRRELKKD
jgi:hypothetical protein